MMLLVCSISSLIFTKNLRQLTCVQESFSSQLCRQNRRRGHQRSPILRAFREMIEIISTQSRSSGGKAPHWALCPSCILCCAISSREKGHEINNFSLLIFVGFLALSELLRRKIEVSRSHKYGGSNFFLDNDDKNQILSK